MRDGRLARQNSDFNNYERDPMKKFKMQKAYLLFALILGVFITLPGCSGNEGGGGEWIQPSTTVTGPTVTSTVPANLATGVQTNRRITATFDMVMDSATITTATFKVTGPLATAVAGTVTYAGETAVFTPTSALAVNSLYTATITTGVKNLAGIAKATDYVWSFTTGLTADITAPKLISTGAADGDTGLPINRDATATFSEAMDPSTLVNPATSFTLTLFGSTVQIPGVVSYLGDTATFNPDSDLLPNTQYTTTITTGAKDLAGNALIAGLRANPWSWTTGGAADTTAPTITLTNPVDAATLVPVDRRVSATFSEAMRLSTMTTANFTVKETVSGADVTGTVAYDTMHNIATFTPLTSLTADTSYTVTVTNGATDLASNALVVPAVGGLPVPNPWTFRTAPASVPPVPLAINLRSAATFGIASGAGMTTTGVTVVNGDVALYPLATCTDATGGPGGSSQTCITVSQLYTTTTGMTVNGKIYYFGDPYDNGGTANSVTNDLKIAWTEGMNKVDTLAGALLGELGAPGPVGKIIVPGVYNEANLGFAAGGVATFDALDDANAIFIIKVGTIGGAGDFVDYGTLLLPTQIKLTRGAQARNIWFVVGRDITIGSGTTWNGNILAGRTATINDGSTLTGRVLAAAQTTGALTLTGAAAPSVTTVTVPE